MGINQDPESGTKWREFNAVTLLGYWDIFKNYYSNKQEKYAYVIHTDVETQINDVASITINGGSPLPQGNSWAFQAGILANGIANIEIFLTQPVSDFTILKYISLYVLTSNVESIPIDNGNYMWIIEEMVLTSSTNINVKIRGLNYVGGKLAVYGYDFNKAFPAEKQPPQLHGFQLQELDIIREAILATPG